MRPHLYLVRHGETSSRPGTPKEGEAIGLSPRGRKQARQVARKLVRRGVRTVVASSLARAQETAHEIAKGVHTTIVTDDRAREFVPIQAQGKEYKDAKVKSREDRSWAGPGGESFDASVERLQELLSSLTFDGTVVVVTHELLMQNLLQSLGRERSPIPHTGCVTLARSEGVLSVVSLPHQSLISRILARF